MIDLVFFLLSGANVLKKNTMVPLLSPLLLKTTSNLLRSSVSSKRSLSKNHKSDNFTALASAFRDVNRVNRYVIGSFILFSFQHAVLYAALPSYRLWCLENDWSGLFTWYSKHLDKVLGLEPTQTPEAEPKSPSDGAK